MPRPGNAPGKPLIPAVRALLLLFCVLTALAANQLFVFSRHTADGFSWTIQPPLTAAFLGAGYAAGFVLSVLSLRRGTWGSARVGYGSVLVFTLVALAATLLHLDRFHFASPGLVPRAAAWVWLAVYLVVPAAMLLALPRQRRAPGQGAPGGPRLGRPLRAALGVQAAVMGAAGVALFMLPSARQLWPWALTPLTARMIASWLLALAAAAVLVLLDDDLQRLRPAAATYAVLGVLQLVALARFAGDVAWDRTSAWVYLAALLSVLAVGCAGLVRAAAGGGDPHGTRAPVLSGQGSGGRGAPRRR